MNKKLLIVCPLLLAAGCKINTSNPEAQPMTNLATQQTQSNFSFVQLLKIHEDGQAIMENGIFSNDCVYGLKKSLSDHAPVIYDQIATWNICFPASHIRRGGGYLTHKFRVNADDALVDEANMPVFTGNKSEIDEMGINKTQVNSHYEDRLASIALRIKELFARYFLTEMAIQEVAVWLPKKFFNDFAAALGPELVYLPPQKNFADNNKSPDVALIAKAGSRLNAQSADFKNRMQPYCDDFSKSCVVSAHFSQPNTDDALMALCQSIDSLASELHNHGYKQVTFIGDFNVTAQRLAKICTRWEKRPQLKTTPGAGSSCSDNSGAITPKNIDLLLEFNY